MVAIAGAASILRNTTFPGIVLPTIDDLAPMLRACRSALGTDHVALLGLEGGAIA